MESGCGASGVGRLDSSSLGFDYHCICEDFDVRIQGILYTFSLLVRQVLVSKFSLQTFWARNFIVFNYFASKVVFFKMKNIGPLLFVFAPEMYKLCALGQKGQVLYSIFNSWATETE